MDEYRQFDPMELGEYFTRHMMAMTAEGLHNKGDIAMELGYRDKRIAELEDRLFALGEMEHSPCFCCGYNGPNYYQPSAHPCAERHHRLYERK